MRLTVDNADTGTLKVQVGNLKEYVEFKDLDLDKIYQWYPMNIYYKLRYQEPKNRLYLYPIDNPPMNVDYDYARRKRTRPEGVLIKEIGPDMVCLNVFKDNVQLSMEAESLGLPHLLMKEYRHEDVKEGIKRLLKMLDGVKTVLEMRLDDEGILKEYRKLPVDEQDKMLYSYATTEEAEDMKMIGKMYNMLNLMRKISKVREEEMGKV